MSLLLTMILEAREDQSSIRKDITQLISDGLGMFHIVDEIQPFELISRGNNACQGREHELSKLQEEHCHVPWH